MARIVLPECCDRAAAEALLPELAEASGCGAFEIDASATTRIGQAMLQLLVSARRTSDGARIISSPALDEAAQLTGLATVLFDGSDA